jgi:hypothetical protein
MPELQQRETEVAQVLRWLAVRLPPHEREALARLIANSLADPPAAMDRNKAFGLLMRMVRADGVIPTEPEYQAALDAATAAGEDWPSIRSLCRRYGSWSFGVQHHLARYMHYGGASGLPRSFVHTLDRPDPGTYSRPEVVLQAIIAFHQRYDTWPTEWEYHSWARAQRAAARAAGKPLPLYPDALAIQRAYGTFADALAAAKERAAELGLTG